MAGPGLIQGTRHCRCLPMDALPMGCLRPWRPMKWSRTVLFSSPTHSPKTRIHSSAFRSPKLAGIGPVSLLPCILKRTSLSMVPTDSGMGPAGFKKRDADWCVAVQYSVLFTP